MKISFALASDSVSQAIDRKLKSVANRTGIHQAMGLAVISLAKRAFNNPQLRPAPWAQKANGQPATLRKSGTLAKSVVVSNASDSGVVVGTDRKYAAIHQLGGKTAAHTITAKPGGALKIPGIGFRKSVKHPGSKIPARPYFPFLANGQPTAQASMDIIKIIELKVSRA